MLVVSNKERAVFVRVKKSGGHEYLQVVHNQRVGGKVNQHVLGTLGRLDRLLAEGRIGDGTCSPIWTWSSSTRPRSTSKAREAGVLANGARAKTTGRT